MYNVIYFYYRDNKTFGDQVNFCYISENIIDPGNEKILNICNEFIKILNKIEFEEYLSLNDNKFFHFNKHAQILMMQVQQFMIII